MILKFTLSLRAGVTTGLLLGGPPAWTLDHKRKPTAFTGGIDDVVVSLQSRVLVLASLLTRSLTRRRKRTFKKIRLAHLFIQM